MSEKGMFYTNVNDYETKEDIMNDFIALRMYDMQKDKEIERLRTLLNTKENIIKEAREYIEENYPTSTINYQDDKYKLLQILDKGENND